MLKGVLEGRCPEMQVMTELTGGNTPDRSRFQLVQWVRHESSNLPAGSLPHLSPRHRPLCPPAQDRPRPPPGHDGLDGVGVGVGVGGGGAGWPTEGDRGRWGGCRGARRTRRDVGQNLGPTSMRRGARDANRPSAGRAASPLHPPPPEDERGCPRINADATSGRLRINADATPGRLRINADAGAKGLAATPCHASVFQPTDLPLL